MPRPAQTAVATALTLLAFAACSTTGAERTGTSTHYGQGVSELEVQALVMQMADDYNAALGEATYLMLRNEQVDATGRWLSLSFLRNGMGAALDIAAGPNPDVALLDLLVLGSLQTWSFERHWIPAGIDAECGQKAAVRLHVAEAELWDSARRLLTPPQEATLRKLIADWQQQHPDQTVVSFVRFADFLEERKLATEGSHGSASGLLREIGDATAVVEDARLFGERAMWYAARYPYVLGQQAELTAYRMVDQPEVRQARQTIVSIERATTAMAERLERLDTELESLFQQVDTTTARVVGNLGTMLADQSTRTLDGLAMRVEQARAAAIDHLFAHIDVEAERMGSMLGEARSVATVAAEAGRALGAAAEAADRLASRFDRDENSGRPPLRLEDLRATAVAAEGAARQLDTALTSLRLLLDSDRLTGTLAAADQTTTGLANALFLRGAGLIALLVLGLAALRLLPARVR